MRARAAGGFRFLAAIALLGAGEAHAQPEPVDPDEDAPGAGDVAQPDEDAGAEVEAGVGAGVDAVDADADADAAAAGAAADADEDAEAAQEEETDDLPRVNVGAYLSPGFGLRVRDKALPRDELDFGFFGEAGIIFDADVVEYWSAYINLIFSSQAFTAVTDVETFDLQGDGTVDGLDLTRSTFPGSFVEEATVRFAPLDEVYAAAGVMRIPFTLQQQSSNTALMFPNRAPPNEVFLSGADIGTAVFGNVLDGKLTGSFGLFNGDSLGLTFRDLEPRGIVVSGRADVNPFGEFPFGEGDPNTGPFRLGVGGGMLWRPAKLYDRTGYSSIIINDFRFSASLRLKLRGLYVGVEYLRRQQTDSFTSRPQVADGAYAQGSVFLPVTDAIAVEPIARMGFVVDDQGFAPTTIGWTDAGISLYPATNAARPDSVRITLQYLGERRFTEGVDAHGAAAAFKLQF